MDFGVAFFPMLLCWLRLVDSLCSHPCVCCPQALLPSFQGRLLESTVPVMTLLPDLLHDCLKWDLCPQGQEIKP